MKPNQPRPCAVCGRPVSLPRFDYCSQACYRTARHTRPYNVSAMARRLGMHESTLRSAIRAGRWAWSADGMSGTLAPPRARQPRLLPPYTHRPNNPILCPRCREIGPRAGKRPICWTCDQELTARGMRFCLGGQHDAHPDTFTPRHGTCRACVSAAYHAKRAGRPATPLHVCRVCGCQGRTVPLYPVPEDAGGGWLCRLCLVEGLRRAA
ncbi:MAG TPA: hypothetical protein VFT99_12115 [Roseiflexaceae bacterium]|nr:hypothetical protein [Roseiflexaceae bacterium]